MTGAKHDVEDPGKEFTSLLSHAVQERLKTIVEKLSVIAEHRLDIVKVITRNICSHLLCVIAPPLTEVAKQGMDNVYSLINKENSYHPRWTSVFQQLTVHWPYFNVTKNCLLEIIILAE